MALSEYHRVTSFILLVSILSLCTVASAVEFAGGTGEPNDPYQIATAGQLVAIGSDPNLLSSHFILVGDIDLDPNLPGGRVFDRAAVAPEFMGRFDGQGHVVSRLHIVSAGSYLGMFGRVAYAGVVVNVRLKDVEVITKTADSFAGALIGYNLGLVEYCESAGVVSGCDYTGGLVGYNGGTICACYSSGSVAGRNSVGGLVGRNSGAVVDCYSVSSAIGEDGVGGLLGHHSGMLARGYVMGPTAALKATVGDLVGFGTGVIIDSYFRGADAGQQNRGLGMPLADAQMGQRASFAGWDFLGEPNEGGREIWWMPEEGPPVLSWQTDRTNLVRPAGLGGTSMDEAWAVLTQAGLVAGQVSHDWDSTIPAGRIVALNPAHPVPRGATVDLLVSAGPCDWQTNPGDGSPANPYQIETAGQLDCLGHRPDLWDKCFVLTNDLDLMGREYNDALVASDKNDSASGFHGVAFTGSLDGKGHRIAGLTIVSTSEYTGLFGMIAEGASVRNLVLTEPYVVGNAITSGGWGTTTKKRCGTGALAGESHGHVSCCGSAGGQVVGLVDVGGLIGHAAGSIKGCYAGGAAFGVSAVGGLVGNCEGAIARSYAQVRVVGAGPAGGLVGSLRYSSTIDCAYAAGSVKGESNSTQVGGLIGTPSPYDVMNGYFLAPESGDGPDNRIGIAVGDMQMRDRATFLGWDFYGTDADGVRDGWYMPANSYPVLSWQTEVTGLASVPPVAGLDPEAARSLIESAGLSVRSLQRDYDQAVSTDRVIAPTQTFCDPNGEGVDLIVSLGPYDWSLNAGDGSQSNPYQIQTAGQLASLHDDPELLDKCFMLTSDISLAGRIFDRALIASDVDDLKDGFQGTLFTGRLDGSTHRIKGLVIETAAATHCLGLFGKIGRNGSVQNLGLEGAYVVGGSSSDYVGALAGLDEGTITKVYATGVCVRGSMYLGGLVGYSSYGGKISLCYTSGVVITGYGGGGLFGTNNGADVRSCYTSALLIRPSSYSRVYGALGGGGATSCYFLQLGADAASGGLYDAQMRRQASFAGWDFFGTQADGAQDDWFMPENGYPILTWQVDTTGWRTIPSVTGMTQEAATELLRQNGIASIEVVRDYDAVVADGLVVGSHVQTRESIVLLISRGPYDWQTTPGQGTVEAPYQIATAGQLDSLSHRPEMWDKHFVLTADLDLVGRSYPNGVLGQNIDASRDFRGTAFTGTFDGRGHVITRLTAMSDGAFVGLFGRIGPGGSVRNLGVTDAQVRGRVPPPPHRECGTATLAGENFGEVLNCYGTGFVYGTIEVGGLVGHNEGLILDCFSLADVVAEQAGGLVGYNASGSVVSCYAAGPVGASSSGGGLVAANGGSVANSYFLNPNDGGGWDNKIGKTLTRTQMMQQSSFAGWDFLGSRTDGTREAWTMPPGGGYPVPSAFYGYEPMELPGSGTAGDPYRIETAEHLGAVHARPRACYRLAANLDLAGMTWSAAPIPGLWGTLDGAGHTISHLSIAQAAHAGLIGVIQSGAEVTNLALDQVAITGPDNASRCGAVVGVNRGKVASCHASGVISGAADLGGLVGWNDGLVSASFADCDVMVRNTVAGGLVGYNSQGAIDQCYAAGRVTGGMYLGGLVGWNRSMVRDSYSEAAVSGDRNMGGLVGTNENQGTIRTCFARGPVAGTGYGQIGGFAGYNAGRIVGGLWDMQASGLTWSAAGMRFTTAEMKTSEPYVLNGWTGDPNWVQDSGDYPHLAWEGAPGGPIPPPQINWLEGSGAADDPYQIATAGQLCRLAYASALWDQQFAVTHDLDLTGVDYLPIGPSNTLFFNGILDGQGHTIKGLTLRGVGSSMSFLGLFGGIGPDAVVRDLRIQDVNIVCTGNFYIGALAGWSQGTISGCSTSGSVTVTATATSQPVGGLIGVSNGTLQDCHAAMRLSVGIDSSYIGGLAGIQGGPSCDGCSSTGSITVKEGHYVGGLIGRADRQVVRCWAETPITIGDRWASFIGGLVGYASAPIACSFAKGDVVGGTDSTYMGGLVGSNNSPAITDCYASGRVEGGDRLGGLFGGNGITGNVTRCWASGQVVGQPDAQRLGGLAGASSNVIEGCYRLAPDSGGGPDNGIGTSLTKEQMMQQAGFEGWDFETIWSICQGKDYPRLRWEQIECGE